MSNELKETVINRYQTEFNDTPLYIVKAPGRINLIGEHTDYSDGFVLPVAINYGVMIAFSPMGDNLLKLYSEDFDEFFEVDLSKLFKDDQSWKEYVKGIAWALQDENYQLGGWQGVIAGDIPIGAGLSSSAALEIATL